MRTIFTILLFLAIAPSYVCPSEVFSDEPNKTLHNKCVYPSVIVKGQDSFGTGVIVRSEKMSDEQYRNVVVSCAHCFQHRGFYRIGVPKFEEWSTFKGYDYYKAYVYSIDKQKDLAVILFESKKPVHVAELDFESRLYIGSDLMHVGCGMGDEHRVDFGKVTSVRSKIPGSPITDAIRTSVYSIPGDSGGPVFHKNKVIGITQAIRGKSDEVLGGPHRQRTNMYYNITYSGISYCIPIARLKTWDEELNNALGFMYKSNQKVPVIPFFIMEWGEAEIENKMMPSNRWTEGF